MIEQDQVGAEGVLLYYYFTPLLHRQAEEHQWYLESCSKLHLVGRCRIARDGVNCTLGGDYHNLQRHAAQVTERYHPKTSIDFKLTKSSGRKNEQCAIESKFTHLTVDVVKEVVTIGLDDLFEEDDDVTAAPITAQHVSPTEFHQILQHAANSTTDSTESDTKKTEIVLVDCRNLYETRLGSFEAEGVTTLDPGTRQFSDLPAWFENNAHKLANKKVLMCCTGGVRCERASAYLLTLGKCFQGEGDVVQLHGGIERYLQQFGQGGFFKGKNFVFDERGDVEGEEEEEEGGGGRVVGGLDSEGSSEAIRGKCCLCSAPWGDYGARARCSACRMLVLLCAACHSSSEDLDKKLMMLCELCHQRNVGGTTTTTTTTTTINTTATTTMDTSQRARILCLHGFRQTAKSFQGRTSALRKRLKNVAEFVFIDAPHTLPDIFGSIHGTKDEGEDSKQKQEKQTDEADQAPTKSPSPSGSSSPPQPQWGQQKRLRRAWLLTPQQYANPDTIPESTSLDQEQYQSQTAGLEESLKIVDQVLDTQGPWDGILGFSQGASLAALLAARECERERSLPKKERRFKFVICCSGYPSMKISPSTTTGTRTTKEGEEEEEEEEEVVVGNQSDESSSMSIPMPSLHVYGAIKNKDRQISVDENKALWENFDATKRVLLRHNNGHIIPATRLAAARMAEFIRWSKEIDSDSPQKEI
jgi:predicted sulfurtransferase